MYFIDTQLGGVSLSLYRRQTDDKKFFMAFWDGPSGGEFGGFGESPLESCNFI
jgi:hypothetical protein